MMRPAPALLWLILAWLGMGLAASFWPAWIKIWEWAGYGMLSLSLVDMMIALSRPRLEVTRRLPGRFALGVPQDVELSLVNHGPEQAKVAIHDGLPAEAEPEGMPWFGTVPGRGYTTVTYPVRLTQRGQLTFGPAHLLRWSPARLWQTSCWVGPQQSTRVYPNYEPVIRYSLLALAHRENQMGIVSRNRKGLSREFHQLREFQEGDILSQIDWKATARRAVLISREYREQRDQRIVVLVDSGRRMRALDMGLPQFDHCLNAVLLMSHIALRQGDQIGVMSFGGTDRWLPPVKGAQGLNLILNHLYDYETTTEPGDFAEAAERLAQRQRRRALVIILTNLRGEDAASLASPLRLMQKQHLVMIASLQEEAVRHLQRHPIGNHEAALRYGSAQLYLEERRDLLENLRRQGVLVVDEVAQLLPLALTNAYLDAKHSGRL